MTTKYQQITVGQDRLFVGIFKTTCQVISTQGEVLDSFKLIKTARESFYLTAFHEGLGIFVVCGKDGMVRAYAIKDGSLAWERQFKPSVYKIVVVPDENLFIIVCEYENHSVLAQDGSSVGFCLLKYHSFRSTALGLVAVQNRTALDVFYNFRTKKIERLLWALNGIAMAASLKDDLIALAGTDSSRERLLRIGRLGAKDTLCQVGIDALGFVAISFAEDGALLLACRSDENLTVLSMNLEGEIKTCFSMPNRTLGWKFSSDGRYLIGRCGILVDTSTFSYCQLT